MSEKIKVGVVGVGYLGRIHAKIYAQMDNVTLVAVVDVNIESAEQVAKEYACEAYSDARDIVDKVDAVSIVVPTIYHLDIAKIFLPANIHTLMEKPIASSYEESKIIVDLAETHNTLLQIGHLERFNAGVIALGKRICAPRFIEAQRIGEFVARATDVDVVTDLMIHDIDIILSLVKSDIKYISAVGTPVVTEHIDLANAHIEFTNGAVANITASRVAGKRLRRIKVFEKNRYETLDFMDQQIETFFAVRGQKEGEWPMVKSEKIAIEPQQPLNAELACFIESINTGRAPLVDGRVGLKALEVALLVKQKMDEFLSYHDG